MYLALKEAGIFRSTDNGTHWDTLNNGFADENMSTVAVVENTVFAGTTRGLYRFDAEVWKKVPLHTSDAIYSIAVSGINLYVGTGPDLSDVYLPPVGIGVRVGNSHIAKIFHSQDLGTS